jgi:hypothetical protein
VQTVKFRLVDPRLNPRRTKMEIPGWSGKPEPRKDGSQEYVWHCMPFTEGAQYGIEIFYPFDFEMTVTTVDGKLVMTGDFGEDPGTGIEWPPFRTFGEKYYTYQLLLDVRPEDGYAVRMEPHPRFYTDTTDTCPIAVPALVRHWWPMLSFMVFKSPAEGRTHIFRPGEPMAQMIVVPAEPDIELVQMGEEEAAERELQGRRIHASRETLSKETQWASTSNTIFDGTYRHILRAAKARAQQDK